jgi:hypothetical protein
MADGSGSTRIDILVKGPHTLTVGIEVKTGGDPPFTKAQLYVYPHLMMGGSVIATNTRIKSFGLLPNTLLPPIPVLRFYVKSRESKQSEEWLRPQDLAREYFERFGRRTRKFECEDLLTKRGLEQMVEDENEDISMIVHDFVGKKFGMDFASREVALALAELLIKSFNGEEFLQTQLPLRISDGGDRWVIEGSRKIEDYPADENGHRHGEFFVEIRKRNCQVLKFAGTGA